MKIVSEDPLREQWRMLSQYAYSRNVKKYFEEKGIASYDDATVEFISGSILQGESYFQAARTASLHIKPLLVYYGTSNLMAGAAAMLTGKVPGVKSHGMKLTTPDQKQGEFLIAEMAIHIIDPKIGALHGFNSVFSECPLIGSPDWTVEEIFGSVPDLLLDFENCYPNAKPYVIPVEIVRARGGVIERISPESLRRFSSIDEALAQIDNLSKSYLPLQYSEQMTHIVLRTKKTSTSDIGVYSLSGRKYLQLVHEKRNTRYNISTLIIMFMGLYALSVLSRYNPERWNPFVKNDSTGEKLLVEKFLDLSERYIPNLIINYLKSERVMFVYESDGYVDLASRLTEHDLKYILDQRFEEFSKRERR